MPFDVTSSDVILVDPLKMIKGLPDEFWIKVPTFVVAHREDPYLYGKYPREYLNSTPADEEFPLWTALRQSGLFNILKVYRNGSHRGSNPSYVVQKVGGFYYRQDYFRWHWEVYYVETDQWLQLDAWVSTWTLEQRDFVEKAQKARERVPETWNRCRLAALRRTKILGTPKEERSKREKAQRNKVSKEKKAVLKHIDSLISVLESYRSHVQDNTVTLENARVVFDGTNKMTSVNGAFKKSLGL